MIFYLFIFYVIFDTIWYFTCTAKWKLLFIYFLQEIIFAKEAK
jgi:hypothetical protein